MKLKLPKLPRWWYLPAGALATLGSLALLRAGSPVAARNALGVFGKSWRDVRGFPRPPHATVDIGTGGPTLGYVTVRPDAPDIATLGGFARALGGQDAESEARYQASQAIDAEFARRRKLLPADANPLKVDRYSRELFVYSWVRRDANLRYYPGHASDTHRYFYTSSVPCVIDEFGRIASCATSKSQVIPLVGKILDVVLPVVAVAVPGYGAAIYSGYLMVKAVAAGGDWKDLAIAAARSQIPPGVEQAAFDFGVAVVLKKESIGDAGEAALLGQMTEGEREAYRKGKEAAQAGLRGDYGEATKKGLEAYYTPR